MYKEIKCCRICGNSDLKPLISLGRQSLTGVFPKTKETAVLSGPLELVKCNNEYDGKNCGLVQLKHSYHPKMLYGGDYGYRSNLNLSMVSHLNDIVQEVMNKVNVTQNDLVVDIGSNDSTLLRCYPKLKQRLVGVDPTGNKFRKYYPEHIELISDFFSADVLGKFVTGQKAKIITSIAMFYDLEQPLRFMQDIYECLADDGIWVFEQSYLPMMLERNSYDTICHEHIEYYALEQIKWMTDRTNFKIIDVQINDINGGSFCITVAKSNSQYRAKKSVSKLLAAEKKMRLSTLLPYEVFKENVYKHKEELLSFFNKILQSGETIIGYGASTKGNVLLQFCGLTPEEIPYIAEVNADKFGCYTPGTRIPIISEKEAKEMNPDYFFVLPWHFKQNIITREEIFLQHGGKLIFPLPALEEINYTNIKQGQVS